MGKLLQLPFLSACMFVLALLSACAGASPELAGQGAPGVTTSPPIPTETSARVTAVRTLITPAPPTAVVVPGASRQAEARASLPPPASAAADAPVATDAPSTMQVRLPFRAWGIAPGGQFYLLDAAGQIHRFSPDLADVLDASGPLFGAEDPGQAEMTVDEHFVIVSSESLTRTLILEHESFAPRGQLDRGGQVALEGARLFILSDDAIWAYNLQDLAAAPLAVTKWPVDPFTPRPRNLAVDAEGGVLLVTLHDVSASPPHQQEWYERYDLDSLQPLGTFPSQLGELTRPSAGGESLVAGMAAKNGFLGSKVAVFDRQGREVLAARPFDGRPVVDAAGEWVYVLTQRATWVLRASDLSVEAVDPYGGLPPVDLLLSPDGQRLYTVWDGHIRIQDTAALRAAGIAPHQGPLPPNWFDSAHTDFFRPRFFAVPNSPETAYVQVGGYGETWRSQDRGKTWEMLPGLVYPNFHYATHLSISPNFASDQTLVAASYSSPMYVRSTDGGDTWAAWEPPVAFVSDRDGNREIYTADRGALRGGPAQNLVRRTSDPAAEENPAWSPGWTRIAFQSNRNGNWDIFTIRSDCDPALADAATACDLRQLTDDPADDMLPAWSPDGRWLAFVSTRGGKADVYLALSRGGTATLLTSSANGAWRPAWLPDGQRFLFSQSREDGSNDIWGSRVIEESGGLVASGEVFPVVDTAWDERDAAAGREFFVYLSNEGGYPRTYGRYNYNAATSFPFTAGTESEGHPAVLEDGTNTLLVTLVRDGQTGVYRTTTTGYEPFAVGEAFNGQPATGPVPWQPDPDWSKQVASDWMK